ncbi:hypothetical protein CBS101457_006168 [Exobasidium rhododendri]|nr:hypothetical protein CBS101457_006168 [Exobasidium rhododendri]
MSATVNSAQNGASSAPSGTSSSGKPAVQPTEVGWLFVPQYYTFLNNDPNKLHCFYTKRSTLVHGTELEEATLCFGQQQIHDKIVSLGFSDAKVFVSNVDSQASAAGGIIIQVLGEMSNDAGPWRKFVQTFFLAEQTNGYFVLNDIFRYLKEDGVAEEDTVDVEASNQEEIKGSEKVEDVEIQPGVTAPADALEHLSIEENASSQSVAATPVEDAHANGIIKPQLPTPAEPSEIGLSKKVTSSAAEDVPATRGATEAAQATSTPANNDAPTPSLNGTSTTVDAPKVSAPSAPKTWANLAASNATKWGTTVNSETRGVSSAKDNVPAPSKSSGTPAGSTTAATSSASAAASKNHGGPGSVFIKNVVVEQMPEKGLQAALEAQFGPLKECQVIPSKACAFAEFASVESAKKAIQMSLPVAQGGEGGVKVGTKGWFVIVEEKRKQSDRPQANGGANTPRGGSARGGGTPFARGGSRGGSRGGPAGRGGARTAA